MTSWGRWGADDERGAVNAVGPEQVLAAVAEISAGRVITLAAPIVAGRGYGLVGRPAPVHLMMRDGGDYAAGLPERGGFGFADDMISLPTHSTTHLDALSHVWRDGEMYNGIPSRTVTSRGAARLGIDKMGPVVTRGVFVDAASGGIRSTSEPVGLDELRELLTAREVKLQPGDALIVRTGWMEAALRGEADGREWPGLDRDCGPWLAEQEVVVVGADNPGVEVFPSTDPSCQVPLHIELIRGHGIYFNELMHLAELAASGRSTFVYVVSALPVAGAVGSPVAPLAVL